MASQVVNGKAFEWAVANAVSQQIDREICDDASSRYAYSCFGKISAIKQSEFETSALRAVKHVLKIERHHAAVVNPEYVEIASDDRGKRGDVRDVLIVAKGGELGFSCKNNHDALKHSRLSSRIDFIAKWGLDDSGCSDQYWAAVRPLFAALTAIKAESQGSKLFAQLEDVGADYYQPILNAFSAELERVMGSGSTDSAQAAGEFVKYIIGRNDFYKVMNMTNQTSIQGFNFGGTLSVTKSKTPTQLVALDRFDGGQFAVTARFNRGYAFNFRIHSASSRVEPSFKFDVKGISFGNEVYQHHITDPV